MNELYLRQLPALFSASVLREVASAGSSQLVDCFLQEGRMAPHVGGKALLRDVFEAAYRILRRQYRCEYVFKNAIATKLLLGRHSLRTASLIQEFRAGGSKADAVIVNGTSTVYEIKTGLDNLDRLANQVADYRHVFDRICVVTEWGLENRIADAVGPGVGVIVLTPRHTLRTVREPDPNAENVAPGVIFDSLRDGERAAILKREFGEIPTAPNGVRYRVYKEQFVKIPPIRAHAHLVRSLAARVDGRVIKAKLAALPSSLTAAAMAANLSAGEFTALATSLNRTVS